jgi:putative component of toxin-antitoxin plasmid stabilization module
VYYASRGEQLLLLLGGGSKATQINDIAKALDLNRNFEDHAP